MTDILRKITGLTLRKTGGLCLLLGQKIYQSPEELRAHKWFQDNGDRTHRLKYDLDDTSVVIDLGGYQGQWASDIFGMYRCEVHVFEPVPHFANEIRQRFLRNPKIHVHDFGLADKDGTVTMHLASDGSSVYRAKGDAVCVRLMDAVTFLKNAGIRRVDLMKINIEGGEYDLLDRLIDAEFVANIRNIQVQFHDCVSCAAERMRKIQNALSRTHKVTYQYEFVWENWEATEWPPLRNEKAPVAC